MSIRSNGGNYNPRPVPIQPPAKPLAPTMIQEAAAWTSLVNTSLGAVGGVLGVTDKIIGWCTPDAKTGNKTEVASNTAQSTLSGASTAPATEAASSATEAVAPAASAAETVAAAAAPIEASSAATGTLTNLV